MCAERIVVPRLTYKMLGEHAEAFLREHHPSRAIPVPVEEIVELGLGIDIFPLPGLTQCFADDDSDGIMAFVASSLKQITVDEYAWKCQTPRFRFSLAHELAHIVLHGRIIKALGIDSIETWAKAIRSIPEDDYGWMDWQAHCFAGHLLVPTQELAVNLERNVLLATKNNLDLSEDAVGQRIEKKLGDLFRVSSAVIHKRIELQRMSLRA